MKRLAMGHVVTDSAVQQIVFSDGKQFCAASYHGQEARVTVWRWGECDVLNFYVRFIILNLVLPLEASGGYFEE